MKFKKLGAVVASVVAASLVLAGCSAKKDDHADHNHGGAEKKHVKIGVVGANEPYWEDYKDAAKKEGIEIELVDFADYNQPNPALTAKELDLNQFQHIIYLAKHNANSGDNLVPIGSTGIYPLALFSKKHKKVDEFKKGAEIAIPNDPSNRARALLVLQQAKLLKLKDGGSPTSTPDDIIAADSKVKVKEVDASFTAASINDVDGAVVNNDFVVKAGLNFKDALFQDDPKDPSAFPYINIFAARAADKDNPTYKKLVEIYQNSEKVKAGVVKASGGSGVLVKTPVSELQETLDKLVKKYKK
ncbi:MAG: MetQ/NlpA family ABC transporter substrate-binding protein [Microbacteriaceae bacterium]|nr:MetQ/NlpA family ABC transporter substrate-binding protein [Microbacteriaceae bacterium]